MKLYIKKVLACGLSILTLVSMPLYAANTEVTSALEVEASSEKPVLALETAIQAALSSSNDLSLNSKQDKVYKEQLEYMNDLSTLTYQTLYTSKQQNAQNREFLKEKISYDVTKRYYEIMLAQEELSNLSEDIALKEKELRAIEIKKELGLATMLDYDAKQVELDKLKADQTAKTEALTSLKANFKTITNIDVDQYTIEGDIALDKLETTNSEGLINSVIQEYLRYSKELAQISLDHIMDNYQGQAPTVAEYTQTEYDAKKTISSLEEQEDSLKQSLTTMYANLLSIEEQIATVQAQISLLETQLKVAKAQYEAGHISKLEYDLKVSGLKDSQYSLDSLINSYNLLKEQICKPWVM